MEAGLAQYLLGIGGLRDIVADRIYPAGKVPGDVTGPRVTYQRISTERPLTLGGTCGLVRATVQLDCHGGEADAHPYGLAKSVAEALRIGLNNFEGTWNAGDTSWIIRKAFVTNEQEITVPLRDGGEFGDTWVSFDFAIWFNEGA